VNSSRFAVSLGLLLLAFALLACGIGPRSISVPQVPVTSAPVTKAPATTAPPRPQPGSILPTTRPGPTIQPKSTTTAAARVTAAPVATAKTVQPSPTLDPKRIVITAEDIVQAMASGAGEEQGLKVQGLNVRFADEKMSLTADELSVGLLQVRKLAMVGTLFASNGKLQFESESVSPGGLATAMLPAVANQVLAQFANNWYVEEAHVRDGHLELHIR
jgi:hypothetical protein